MQAIEFTTTVHNGVIEVPESFRNEISCWSDIRVLVLRANHASKDGSAQVRDHSSFLNSFVAADEGLYDDLATR